MLDWTVAQPVSPKQRGRCYHQKQKHRTHASQALHPKRFLPKNPGAPAQGTRETVFTAFPGKPRRSLPHTQHRPGYAPLILNSGIPLSPPL